MQAAWALMLLQGLRRMLESWAYTSNSQSKMWFGHWALGLLFYLTINISIWIESIHSHVNTSHYQSGYSGYWRMALLVPAILTSHVLQNSYHAYLYRLRKSSPSQPYQLPNHQLFPGLLCPHYTCEVLIYLCLASLAAPEGRRVNWTVLCAAIFVAVNLGVTAVGTKEWYVRRFGVEKVGGRKRMVPGIW